MTLLPLNDGADCLAFQNENRVAFLSIAVTADRSPCRARGLLQRSLTAGQSAWLPFRCAA